MLGSGQTRLERVGGAGVLEQVFIPQGAAHARDNARQQGVELGAGRWRQAHEGGFVVVLPVERAIDHDAMQRGYQGADGDVHSGRGTRLVEGSVRESGVRRSYLSSSSKGPVPRWIRWR